MSRLHSSSYLGMILLVALTHFKPMNPVLEKVGRKIDRNERMLSRTFLHFYQFCFLCFQFAETLLIKPISVTDILKCLWSRYDFMVDFVLFGFVDI